MAIFGDQSERLLRESWSGADELAQELYAIFTDSGPLEIDSPVQISTPQGSTVPPLSLENNGVNPAAIQFTTAAVPSQDFGQLPALPPLPGLTLTSIYGDGSAENFPGAPANPTPGTGTPAGGGSGGGVPGMVTGGGPGAGPYQVKIFPTGLAGPSKTVNVTQLQIDPADTIPPGSWTIVNQVGKFFYMMVPVWL